MEDREAMKPFSMKRKVYAEFKEIEKKVKDSLKGWFGYTELKNINIILMYADQGAKPYEIDQEKKLIWFKKGVL